MISIQYNLISSVSSANGWIWFRSYRGTSELDLSLAGVSDAWRVRGIAADLPYLTHRDPHLDPS